jgi:hypothetical protein
MMLEACQHLIRLKWSSEIIETDRPCIAIHEEIKQLSIIRPTAKISSVTVKMHPSAIKGYITESKNLVELSQSYVKLCKVEEKTYVIPRHTAMRALK